MRSFREYPFRFTTIFVLVALSCITGCREKKETGTQNRLFGDPYELVSYETPASPDVWPLLTADSLVVRVKYTGGCTDHSFDLEYRVVEDTAKIWIQHDRHGDDCVESVQDEYRYRLPGRVVDKPVLLVLDPADGPPYQIK